MITLAEFYPLIGPTIPGIIDLAKDSNGPLRMLCVNALRNFSQQGKMAKPLDLALLITIIAELWHFISPAIHVIVNLLKDTDSSIDWMHRGAFSELLQQGDLSLCFCKVPLTLMSCSWVQSSNQECNLVSVFIWVTTTYS